MPKISLPFKGRGCLQAGCLTVIIAPILIVTALFFVLRSSHKAPDRFVLVLPLSGTLNEINSESSALPFMPSSGDLSLQEALFVLDHATTDEHVGEVLLDIGDVQASPAKIAEMRSAVEKVRKRGKKVTAFLHDSTDDNDYLLASACSSIVMERGGYLLLDGLKAESFFYTTPLEKLGVQVQAAQWKSYKSGIEPYVRTGASKEYFEQINALLDDFYSDYLNYVSEHRKLSPTAVEAIINNEALLSASRAKALGLVDSIASSWELQRSLTKKITGEELSSDNDAYRSAADYRAEMAWPQKSTTDDAIAVVTISGTIVRSATEMSDGTDVATVERSLNAALENKKVKAIVLRIDSPGGDALASADMLQMLHAAAAKKPLVVSMSGVAASGGYMAALAGKTIIAHPLTITGSIGVYTLKPNISALADKIGLKRDVVTRGRYADANTPFKPLEGEAYNKFIAATGETYNDFIGKVATSRKMSVAAVDTVAGGRVWTGSRALKAGLVDRMGGLFDAIHLAQERAGIDKAEKPAILLYPVQKSWFETLFASNSMSISERIALMLQQQFMYNIMPKQQFSSMQSFYEMLTTSGKLHILAMMPGEVVVK